MPADAFVTQLNKQIANEFAASQQYVACAVFYDAEELPQLARFFYRQALEERQHALMMIRYLLDTDCSVVVPEVQAPKSDFSDVVEPVALALEQEQRVGEEINGLARTAREAGDYASEQIMAWFIREQIEEVSTMSSVLKVVERSRDEPGFIEDYIAREHPGVHADDPTAPPAAGE